MHSTWLNQIWHANPMEGYSVDRTSPKVQDGAQGQTFSLPPYSCSDHMSHSYEIWHSNLFREGRFPI